jgi:metallo-beta-lactamase family protein
VKLQFLGATRQVTGSRYYLEANGSKILVDCGMFQEHDLLDRNWDPSPIPAEELDAVVLTHAHLDHCGLLPRLVHEGFRGRILATSASADLVELVLYDSAQIQLEDVEFKRKRHRKEGRQGKFPEQPLYTERDVARTVPMLEPVEYGQTVAIGDHIKVAFHDAGHILGSAVVEFQLDGESPRRLLFSGDLGQWDKPILRDPTVFDQADYIVMESTYGSREHEHRQSVEVQLGEIIRDTIAEGGNVVMPTFAIERAQEVMYYLSRLLDANQIPRVPVFLDSPMAVEATTIFERHPECFDDETRMLIREGRHPFRFPKLQYVRSAQQSKAINDMKNPAIIMATSGMCVAGRIKHHLAHNIGRPNATILFTGYQGRGTLGRQILDGNHEVRIHGRELLVRAKVTEIQGFSGHADRSGLLRWLGSMKSPPKQLFITHGEEESAKSLADYVRETKGWQVTVPEYQQSVELN